MRTTFGFLVLTILLLSSLPLAARQPAQEAEGQTPFSELVRLPALLERATYAAREGDNRQAALDYSLFLLFNPTAAPAWHGRGNSQAQEGNYNRALRDFSRALEFSNTAEGRASVLFDRANVYLQQNRLLDALGDLDAAIRTRPQDVNSLHLRARILAAQERNAAALADYNALLEVLPGDPDILLERGYFHTQSGDIEAAEEDFNTAVALAPDNATLRAERGAFRAGLGDLGAGLTDIDAAIRLDPENGGFLILRATLLQEAGEGQAAADDYLRWLMFIRREMLGEADLAGRGDMTVDMRPGRIIVFPFEGRAGQTLNAAATSVIAGQVDSLLVLTDDMGVALVADDDGDGGLDARIADYVLPRDGVYSLMLGHAGGEATGALRVRLSLSQG